MDPNLCENHIQKIFCLKNVLKSKQNADQLYMGNHKIKKIKINPQPFGAIASNLNHIPFG